MNFEINNNKMIIKEIKKEGKCMACLHLKRHAQVPHKGVVFTWHQGRSPCKLPRRSNSCMATPQQPTTTQWPCLQVENQQRPNYLPMNVCKIVEGQRYSKRLNDRQIIALLKVTCLRLQEREYDIM